MKTAAALLLILCLAACGSTSRQVIVNRTTPKAQEAADLATAYNAGLLSAAEYAAQRRNLGLGQ